MAHDPETPLAGVRLLAALNGLELFGQERDNIEVYKSVRALGGSVWIGINARDDGGDVGQHLRDLAFPTFPLPFGNQWSLRWLRQNWLIVFGKARSVLRCSASFRDMISTLGPTHVLLGSPLTYSYLSIALATCKVPLIYRMGDRPPFDSPFNLQIWRLAMRRASQVVAVSNYVRGEAFAGGVNATPLSVIYNLAPSIHEAPGEVVMDRVAIDGRIRRIVYVGAVSEHKGVRQLVRAFALLHSRFPDLVMDVVGGSRYDAQFRWEMSRLIEQAGIGERVVMHGQQRDPTPFYRNAEVHVAPSLCEEALGNVVLEAKREGVPSVIFRSGGLPEMIRHGVDGLICEEKTPEALATGIATLLEDEDRRHSAGRAARQDFEARFGPERFARQWAEVFLRQSSGAPRDHTRTASENT